MSTPAEIIEKALSEGRKHLMEHEAKAICAHYGIPVTKIAVARDEEEAVAKAREIGYPVVLKIVSPDILHKTDVGGVVLDLKSDDEVRQAYRKIMENVRKHKPDARIVGVLVQEMAPQSTEVIVGGIRDPQFGPALMFGLGGIFVEVLKDVTFRIAPVSKEEAMEMIREIKAYPILEGYRGAPKADFETLTNIITAASRLMMENERIDQLDLNPIMVYEKGAKVVDARIILK